jgi:hypothetical protein
VTEEKKEEQNSEMETEEGEERILLVKRTVDTDAEEKGEIRQIPG